MRSRDLIFSLLASATVAPLATVGFETSMHAEMFARMQPPGDDDARLSFGAETGELVVLAAPEVSFSKRPFAEAVEEFKKAVPMSAEEYRALEDEHKARGFYMARSANMGVLRDAHAAITTGVEQGTPKAKVMAGLRASYTSNGETDPGESYLSLVYDNAVLKSYGQGRWRQVTHPDVLRLRPFAEYYTRHDERVRPAHKAVDGTVAELGSVFWQRWWPPNGHRCRCGARTLSRAQVEERGLTPVEDVPNQAEVPGYGVVQLRPEPGWGGSPATAQTAEAVAHQVERAMEHGPLLRREPAGLVRDDAARAKVVERLAGMDESAIAEQLAATPRFHVHPSNPEPRAGELRVDWHCPSQNTDGALQLVTRTVEEPGLFRLRDRIDVAPRAAFDAAFDPAARPDPEIVWSPALAAKVSPPDRTVGMATEAALRFHAADSAELQGVLELLWANGERRPYAQGEPPATPVKYAAATMDAEVWAGSGAELPAKSAQWKRAVRNLRRQADGREVSVLSRRALSGWDRAVHVLVNARLWAELT